MNKLFEPFSFRLFLSIGNQSERLNYLERAAKLTSCGEGGVQEAPELNRQHDSTTARLFSSCHEEAKCLGVMKRGSL
jgi:hypothetical protein